MSAPLVSSVAELTERLRRIARAQGSPRQVDLAQEQILLFAAELIDIQMAALIQANGDVSLD